MKEIMMKKLVAKFKPNNNQAKDLIVDQIMPLLDQRVLQINNAFQEDVILAVSPFFAHAQCEYVVDCSIHPLFEEIRNKLVGYGWLRPDDHKKDVFKLALPNSRLEFRTLNYDPAQPRIETTYITTYLDGTYHEVDRQHIALINGYAPVTWDIVNPELQVAYLTEKVPQHQKQYFTLDNQKLPNSVLKADKEELLSTRDKIIDAAASDENVWRYKDGLISGHLPYIEKAVRDAIASVVGRVDFKFLAEIKKSNLQREIETVESTGGTF